MPVLGAGGGARGQAGSQLAVVVAASPQRSVVQATPQVPKAGPVQQLTVQGLQPVHVAQEVCVSPTCLWANWGSVAGWGGGKVQAPQATGREWSPPGGGEAAGTLRNPPLPWTPNSNHGPQAFLFASTGQFRAQALLRESSGLSLP